MIHKINHANIKEWAKNYDGPQFDGILCDPPYELGFMGKSWDSSGIAFDKDMWADLFRHIKPGGHLLAFSGSRTYHRMAVAIEDAGFEIRDMIEWVYGSGFPKSLNIGKAVDKIQGNKREASSSTTACPDFPEPCKGHGDNNGRYGETIHAQPTKGTSDWEGYRTALKPAHEPCVLARKPIEGTVANNVLKHGVGGLNIDGSRVVAYNEQYDNTKGYKGCVGSQNSKRGDNDELPNLQQRVQGLEVLPKEQEATTHLFKDMPSKEHDGGEKSELEGRNVEGQPNGLHDATSGQAIAERPRVSEQRVKSGDATQSSDGEKSGKTTEKNRVSPPQERDLCRQQAGEPAPNGLGGTQQGTSQGIERDDTLESGERKTAQTPIGRWPSNLIHDGSDEVEAVFPQTKSGSIKPYTRQSTGQTVKYNNDTITGSHTGDSGSASRFFYTAKASKSERNAGLEGFEEVEMGRNQSSLDGGKILTGSGNERSNTRQNHHPTVKPLALTKYLATLIKPPQGGRLLVPFSGSGSEMIGALQAGWEEVIGVELTEEYIPIAEARIKYWTNIKEEESNQMELI